MPITPKDIEDTIKSLEEMPEYFKETATFYLEVLKRSYESGAFEKDPAKRPAVRLVAVPEHILAGAALTLFSSGVEWARINVAAKRAMDSGVKNADKMHGTSESHGENCMKGFEHIKKSWDAFNPGDEEQPS